MVAVMMAKPIVPRSGSLARVRPVRHGVRCRNIRLPAPAPPPISTEAPTGLPDVNVAHTVPDWFSWGSQGTPDWFGSPGGGSGVGSEPRTGTGPASDEPLRSGGVIECPRKVRDVAAEYPILAHQARVEGMVVIDAIIGADGRVRQATVRASRSKLLEDAALAAVRQWEYRPTRLNGVPVALIMTVEVHFN